jgi:hypothetical protein
MQSGKNTAYPKDFYEKGKELLKQASAIPDEDLRREAIRAALRYYAADLKQDTKFIVTIIVLFGLVAGTTILAFLKLQFISALAVVLCAFAFFSLLIGVLLRRLGYISESSLVAIWKASFKLLRDVSKTKKGSD